MAARRTRIKGIANIPQRRKTENVTSLEVTKENDIPPNLNVPDVTLTSIASDEKDGSSQPVSACEKETSELQLSEESLQQVPVDVTEPIVETVNEKSNTELPKPTETKAPLISVPFKRRFAKPILSTNLINRKPKSKPEETQNHLETSVLETETQPPETLSSTKKDSVSKSVHFALNETEITDSGVVQHVSKLSEENAVVTGM